MAHIKQMQIQLAMLEQTILLKAFKNDDDNILYNWMLDEYSDVSSDRNVAIKSLIEKYKKQKPGTLEELEYVGHLYNTYVVEYLK